MSLWEIANAQGLSTEYIHTHDGGECHPNASLASCFERSVSFTWFPWWTMSHLQIRKRLRGVLGQIGQRQLLSCTTVGGTSASSPTFAAIAGYKTGMSMLILCGSKKQDSFFVWHALM